MSHDSDEKTGQKSPEDLIRFVEDLKRQWMSTIDALVDPLMIVKPDFTVHKANKAMAKMAGLELKQLLGQRCYKIFADRDSPCRGCSMRTAVESGDPQHYNLESIRNDRYYEVTSQPIVDSQDQIEGIAQVYRDRTNAKRMQEQLTQQEKLASIGLLAGGVAHEINNPLGGILIFSQMVLREMDQENVHYQDIVEIEAATQRCKAIVESLLDFARQQPSNEIPTKPVDVTEAAKTALRFGKVSLQSIHIDVEESFDSEAQPVLADRNKLIQVFLNLIQNAFQAMPDGGTLTLTSRRAKEDGIDVCIFDVVDTGIGIPHENLMKIFDPFFTTKDPGEGTGLGLAICYGIVQDLGGNLTAESAVNVGTKFTVTLPLAKEAAQQSAS